MKLSTETWILIVGAGAVAAYYFAKSQAQAAVQNVNPQTGLTGAQTIALSQANQSALANAANLLGTAGQPQTTTASVANPGIPNAGQVGVL